ncbi:MAG: endonuclease III [Gemmatimonadota bacterium]
MNPKARRGMGGGGRAAEIARRLADAIEAKTELVFSNPLECAVATILSAQSTDRRVNEVTADLFRTYRAAKDYADADPATLEREIHSTGFFRQKTKSLIALGRALVERHDGRVPDTMDALTELPGIGRKTANVILSAAFGKDEGIVVDTHVKRVANRLGLTEHDDPEKIERDLMELVPREAWGEFGLRLILHGRRTCTARKPKCGECVLEDVCPSAHTFD